MIDRAKNTMLIVTVTKEQKQYIADAAERESMSMACYVRQLVKKDMAKHVVIEKTDDAPKAKNDSGKSSHKSKKKKKKGRK